MISGSWRHLAVIAAVGFIAVAPVTAQEGASIVGKVKLTGEAKHWNVTGDNGNVKAHGFCPTCGSPVYLTFAYMSDRFTVHAASLDDPGRYKPQMVTYGVRGHAWDRLDPAVPKFDPASSFGTAGIPARRLQAGKDRTELTRSGAPARCRGGACRRFPGG